MKNVSSPDRVRRYYDQVALYYEQMRYEPADGRYAPDAERLRLVAEVLGRRGNLKVLDIGCGPGVVVERLVRDRHEVFGIDISPVMVQQCQARLVRLGSRADRVAVGRADDLSAFSSNSFDAVLALEVVNHLDDAAEERCYGEIARVLRPGGIFVAAYRNRLCDLCALDRTTIEFFESEFLALEKFDDEEDKQVVMTAIRGLIQCPALPPKAVRDPEAEKGSGVTLTPSDLLDKCHNPLTIDGALAPFGLKVTEKYFNRFQAFPPLLRNLFPSLFHAQSRRLEVTGSRDWRGLFMAGIFLVECLKDAQTLP